MVARPVNCTKSAINAEISFVFMGLVCLAPARQDPERGAPKAAFHPFVALPSSSAPFPSHQHPASSDSATGSRDGEFLTRDPEGTEFADLETARAEALGAARDVLGDGIKNDQVQDNRQYEITDEAGQVVATVPLMDALKP